MNMKADDTVIDQDAVDAGAGAAGDDTVTGAEGGQAAETNPLELSDEDFLKQAVPTFTKAEPKGDVDEDDKDGDDKDKSKADAGDDEGDGGKPAPKAVDGDEGKEAKPAPKADDKTPVADDKKPADGVKKADEAKPKTDGVVDYKAAYEQLMAPFKANGRAIQARSVDDAISLMQMGANYNKKMAGLKPVIKIAKMLENNGLLDEEKLSFLIDLHAKKPEAINKLVKDSGLNPIDLDPDKADEYRPTTHKVDDREMALDEVLDDIKDSTTYAKTLAVASAWDAISKKVVADHPGVLKLIDSHMQSGIYDLIASEVERDRTFGRLQGLTDIEAYRQVGDAIQARGGFDHLVKRDGANQGKANEAGKVVEPKPKKDAVDESRNEKRRSMGTPRAAAPSGSGALDFNPLGLSDEDFAKQAAPKFK